MNINLADITITSLETINAFTLAGSYRFTLDELQSAKLAHTQEKEDITGKQGRKLSSLKKNKAVVVSGTNGLISAGLLEAQTGGTFTDATSATKVRWYETLTVDSDFATTAYTAVGTAGAEIVSLFIKNADGSLGTEYEQAAAVAAGKFTYTVATKKLTFTADEVDDGTEIYVVYDRQIQASVLKNTSDKFSEKLQLYIDAFGEDSCGSVYRIQFYVAKADFSGDFDLEFGDSQAVHAFEAESLAGNCGGSGNYWTYTIFGANAADYVTP